MQVAIETDDVALICGDALASLRNLADGCIQTVITSPPYWGLRDYGVEGQIGNEPDPFAYVDRLGDLFDEVRRVLKPDGLLWLNLGDLYVGGGGYSPNSPVNVARMNGEAGAWGSLNPARAERHNAKANGGKARRPPEGLKRKDLIGLPWRVAFELQARGWWLRSDVVWAKPNPMPEKVFDRPTRSHEYLFMLAKSERYLYDHAAVAEPLADGSEGTRNRRSVWTVATRPFKGAHFATFPPALVEPCILAGSRPGDLVLDPFSGAGTTGIVAHKHGRKFIGCELNPEYVEITRARWREEGVIP